MCENGLNEILRHMFLILQLFIFVKALIPIAWVWEYIEICANIKIEIYLLHNGFQLKICILHPIIFSNCIKPFNAYLKCSWISYYSLFASQKKEKIEINYTSFVCHLIFICKLVWAISALSNAALNFLLNFWFN